MAVSFRFAAIIIFGVSGFIMVVVSLFTEKIPLKELGGLTWSTINDPPISHGAIGEAHDHGDPSAKAENGTVTNHEAVELLEKKGKATFVLLVHMRWLVNGHFEVERGIGLSCKINPIER